MNHGFAVTCVATVAITGYLAGIAQTGFTFSASPDYRLTLQQLVLEGRLADLSLPDFSRDLVHVKAFYERSAYNLGWVRNGEVTTQAKALIQVLETAFVKGLNAEDYDGSRWTMRIHSIQRTGAHPTASDLARFDLALTVSVMRYVSDLHLGRVNPKLVHSGWDLKHEPYNLPKLIHMLLDAKDVRAVLSMIEPPFPGYRRTEKALQDYLVMAAEDDGEALPGIRVPVEPSAYGGTARLVRLLRRLGDLPSDTGMSQSCDNQRLVDALKHFQRRHALDPDGKIEPATLRELNTPLSRRVRQLQLTLERYRWAPHDFKVPPVIVNIPEFRLRALNASYRSDVEMKIVVGRAYRHQTPVFTGEMKSVVFRPYWEVPPSIQRNEIVPKVAHDRLYLSRHGYEIVTSDEALVRESATDDATLAQLRSGKSRIRQVPGPDNSLGLVKFLFPNEYNVYMHGTPVTALFANSRRDFSHGCIRLEKPEALATWVLKDQAQWSLDKIVATMRGSKTVKVVLDKAVPVLIVYATAVVQENGDVSFFNDIYGHDAALDKALMAVSPQCQTRLPHTN